MISIFDLYFQGLAKNATWVNDQPYYEDNLELNDTINNTVDLEWIEDEEQPTNKKRFCIYEYNDVPMKLYKTINYVVEADTSIDSMEIDLSSSKGA